jgi:hypothetical protein
MGETKASKEIGKVEEQRKGEEGEKVVQARHDLRHELAIIASRARDLEKSILALPETEPDLLTAIEQLTRTERQQAAVFMRQLAQSSYVIRQQALWIRQWLMDES